MLQELVPNLLLFYWILTKSLSNWALFFHPSILYIFFRRPWADSCSSPPRPPHPRSVFGLWLMASRWRWTADYVQLGVRQHIETLHTYACVHTQTRTNSFRKGWTQTKWMLLPRITPGKVKQGVRYPWIRLGTQAPEPFLLTCCLSAPKGFNSFKLTGGHLKEIFNQP